MQEVEKSKQTLQNKKNAHVKYIIQVVCVCVYVQ